MLTIALGHKFIDSLPNIIYFRLKVLHILHTLHKVGVHGFSFFVKQLTRVLFELCHVQFGLLLHYSFLFIIIFFTFCGFWGFGVLGF